MLSETIKYSYRLASQKYNNWMNDRSYTKLHNNQTSIEISKWMLSQQANEVFKSIKNALLV